MKAKELMIGDWVNSYDAQAYKVTSIHINDKGCAVRLEFDEYIVETWADKIEPIPLTEEIIGNNIPFERNWDATRNNPSGSVTEWRKETLKAFVYVYDFRNGDDTYVVEICLRDSYDKKVRLILRYVHELQHALRLCGLNDLADNFKIQ